MPKQFSTMTLALIGLMMLSTIPWIGQIVSGQATSSVFEVNRLLARTVNLAMRSRLLKKASGDLTLREEYFEPIKKAGFTAVRLPIKFSAHADQTAPYKLEPTFLASHRLGDSAGQKKWTGHHS